MSNYNDKDELLKKIELLANAKIVPEYPVGSDLAMFLETCFANFRMLIVEFDKCDKSNVINEIKRFVDYRKLDYGMLDCENITTETIKGEIEIFYKGGLPYSKRKAPSYWPQNNKNKLIVVKNLTPNTDIEVCRAFINVACLGPYFDSDDIPEYMLPKGSGFVFLSENKSFPHENFDGISSYFRDERRIFNFNE